MTAVNLAIQMTVLIMVGFFARKAKMVGADFARHLAEFIFYIVFPCVVFRSVVQDFNLQKIADMSILIVISVLTMAIMLGIGVLVNLFTRKNDDMARILLMNLMFTNFTYMAFPVMEALYGSDGIIYITAYTTPVRVLFYAVTPLLFSLRRIGGDTMKSRVNRGSWKALLSPPVLAVPIGLLFYFLPVSLPEPIIWSIDSLANVATPMGMALCGMTLAEISMAGFFSEKRVFLIAVLRLLIAPAVILGLWMIVSPFIPLDPVAAKVSILYCALPAAASSTIIAMKARADAQKAAQCVLVTTLISVVTLPGWVFFLDLIIR
ncbi:MAG: AEC family transporter [Clostridiaceae bacterium]|jgi:predicted permease|nr:AEC family transporter [Clostridiaceae bacterium]